jgi:carboxypeptidase Taq
MPTLDALWTRFDAAVKELAALEHIDAVAGWDQETYMPPKGAEARGEARAVLRGVAHEKLTRPELGEWIATLEASPELDSSRRAAVRAVKRDRDRELKLPARLVKELAQAQGRGVEAWKVARREDRFEHFRPALERLIALKREQADALGHAGERYDPLLDASEPGMTTARLQPVLERLRAGLVPLVEQLTASPPPAEDAFLRADAWDVDTQFDFSLELIRGLGFDLEAGRLDRSAHPFCSGLAPTDVRLTTRLFRDDGASAIFSALHEAGHGLYEQGLPASPAGTARYASMGLHESQSRLWENFVGRSQDYWVFWFPRLQARFPAALAGVDVDRWVGAINRVRRSLIRVEADEVTYNLHILVRFELELAIVRGELPAAELPGAWRDAYERVLGIRPPDDRDGVLQDIHWAWGEFGYFPTYSIGNMYAATLMAGAERALPTLWDDVARGELAPLRDWLRAHVHRHGRALDADTIVTNATGSGLTEVDLLAHLRRKFGAR